MIERRCWPLQTSGLIKKMDKRLWGWEEMASSQNQSTQNRNYKTVGSQSLQSPGSLMVREDAWHPLVNSSTLCTVTPSTPLSCTELGVWGERPGHPVLGAEQPLPCPWSLTAGMAAWPDSCCHSLSSSEAGRQKAIRYIRYSPVGRRKQNGQSWKCARGLGYL